MRKFEKAKECIESKIKYLRKKAPKISFDKNKLAELEVNHFFYDGDIVDRIMIVLRANGCEHYKKTGGCSMCAHYNGTPIDETVTEQNYKEQWKNLLEGHNIENSNLEIDLNNYPVVCLYNLGSFLNENEISREAARYMFSSLNQFKGVKKTIIESRAEYVTDISIKNIKDVYSGVIEIGIGVESTNDIVRELCHHKGLESMELIEDGIKVIHRNQCKALAYINFKPVFLTEQEAIDDAVCTAVKCIQMGFDAISIEPTSLQEFSLANYLYELGLYRVPWLWSVREIIRGIYSEIGTNKIDIRIGGYFEEQVLSGSQGVGYEGKNEIFPHMTSANCPQCTPGFVEAIKRFNMTYEIRELDEIKECPYCYELWKASLLIRDKRSVEERIIDALSQDA